MASATAPLSPSQGTLLPKRSTRQVRPRLVVAQPFLSVVLVNYCQWRNTARLTRQLQQSRTAQEGDTEIVIVDNCSPVHPLLGKMRRADGVSLRRFSRNRGFARAVNEGARLSRGDWLLLLNPDMSVSTGFLDEVENLARQIQIDDPTVGIIGLGIRNSDGSPQASSGPLPTLIGTLTGLLLPRSRRKCRTLAVETRSVVPWATGCALLIRRDCSKEIGGFDEKFFLYYEDVDFCRRATQHGWKVYVEPNLRVTHHTPLHTRRVPAALRLMTRHALLTYGVKHWPRWQAALLGAIVWLEAGLRELLCCRRGKKRDARINGRIRRIVGDVLRGRVDSAQAGIRRTAKHLEKTARAQDGMACEYRKATV